MGNTSGHGIRATVRAESDKWNWTWAIGNNTFIALLMFVPMVNVVMAFVLGVKGSSWAWCNKNWENVDAFQRVQRNWTKWALIVYAAGVLLFLGIFFAVTASLKDSDAFRLAMEKLVSNREAVQMLGQPSIRCSRKSAA